MLSQCLVLQKARLDQRLMLTRSVSVCVSEGKCFHMFSLRVAEEVLALMMLLLVHVRLPTLQL